MKKLLLLFLPIFLFASLQKVSLQMEWKHQFQYAGFYAAVEQGYYENIGLDVELKEFNQNIDVKEEVLNLNATFGISSSSLILNKINGKPLVLLASYFKQNALALISSPNIKNISELKGKKVMLTSEEVKRTSIRAMFEENGLKTTDYTIIEHDFSINKFVNGEVDAMSIFLSNQPFSLDKLNIKYNTFNPSTYGIYFYNGELFTSENIATSSPKMVKNFINATNKGWEYAFRNKKEIVDLIYNKYSKEKSLAALMFEATQTEKLFKTSTFSIGSIIPEAVALNAAIYEKLGLVKKKINMKNLLSNYIFNSNYKKSKQINFTKEELAFINKKNSIKIANEMDWAPFDYNEFGKPTGLSIEYIKLLFSKAGLKYEFVNGATWDELLEQFKDKKIDLMPAFYKTKQREEYTLFSAPYYQGKLAVYSVDKNNKINSKNDLVGKKVGIEKSDASVSIVKKYLKDSRVIEFSTTAKLLEQLDLKKIDAIVCNPLLLKHYKKNKSNNNINLVEYIDMNQKGQHTTSLCVGVRKDWHILHSILQKTINSLNDNEIIKLKEQWLLDKKNNHLHLNKEEEKYLQNKKITMCIDPNWMPFEKLKYGKHIGISADYFKIIEKNLNTKIKIIPTSSWSQSIEYAKKRKCDMYSLAMKTKERKKYMNFTTPYLSIPLVLATNLDVPFVADFHDLKNKKIGIPKEYAFIEVLNETYKNLNIIEVQNIQDGLNRVKSGELFGYVGTLASIGYIFQTEFTGELKIAGKFNEVWELGIGVRNDDNLLLSIMNKSIDNINEDEKRIILNKWVSIKYENGIDYTLVWEIAIVSILMLLAVLFWTRKLFLLNHKLNDAKIASDEATKAKANFLANMSHEIRTPMNSILGMTYLIKETTLNSIQSSYIQKIETSSRNLLKLINDILDFSKIKAKKLEIRDVDFNLLELLNNIENLLKVKSFEKDLELLITYDKSYSMNLYGDSLRLSQILMNLVSNAIKFTHKGKVELLVKKSDNSKFIFTVSDTGIGLTQKEIDNIFSSFTQADSSITRTYGGTGLGLSISKELVHLMGGKIWIESIPGKGSKFIFEVELKDSNNVSIGDIQKNLKDIKPDEQKEIIKKELADELFSKLKIAIKKRRPQLCEPILTAFERYDLQENQKLFDNVNYLVKKYKFDEARKLLDEK